MRSGSIPDELIQEVLDKTDIVEWIGRTVSLQKSGKGFIGLCPFHSEKTPSFHVLPEKRIFHCFGCGTGGNVIRFVMNTEGMAFPEAVRMLAEEAGIAHQFTRSPAEITPEQREAMKLIQAHEEAAKFYSYVLNGTEEGKAAYEYLKRRGFTQRMIDQFQIGYSPPLWDKVTQFLQSKGYSPAELEKAGLIVRRTEGDGYFDRFRDRVMFPVWDGSGRIIAFNGRSIGDAMPKYLHSPETSLFHKNKVLYPLHLAKSSIRKSGRAVLFEGGIDAVKAWDAGVENGVATLGTALSESHLTILRRYCDKVVICYDGDRAGRTAAYKSVLLCEKAGIHAEVAMLPDGMDPDEYIAANGAEAFRSSIIEKAVPATKYKILYIKKEHTLQNESSKLSFVRKAVSIIAPLESPTERELYIRDLSSETGFSIEALKQELNELREKLRNQRDKNEIPWNNDMNEKGKSAASTVPALRPAYYNAERQLLAGMIQSAEVAQQVQTRLGGNFHVETHAALAAYIYAYYADGKLPDPSGFVGSLHDDELEAVASSVLLTYPQDSMNEQVLEDCLTEVRKHDLELKLRQKQQQLVQAERTLQYDVTEVARLGAEIITLERELKHLGQRI